MFCYVAANVRSPFCELFNSADDGLGVRVRSLRKLNRHGNTGERREERQQRVRKYF